MASWIGQGPPVPGRSRHSTITGSSSAATSFTPLSQAVDDALRVPLVSLVADWDRTGIHPLADLSGVATEVSIERSATGDLPDQIGLVEGPVSAELSATLAGEFTDGTTVNSQLAPYRDDSQLWLTPILGAPVTCSMGFGTDTGPQLVEQFTGQVRSLRVDSASRSVSMTALDPADLLRAPITLPALAMDLSEALNNNHKFYIRPQAVIDFILRKNNIYASPPSHDDAQISCTGHGWLGAETGRSAVPRGAAITIADDAWWTDGPFGMLAVRGVWAGNSTYQEFFSREQYTPVAGNGIGMSAWIHLGKGMGVPTGEYRSMFQLFPLVDHAAFSFEMGVWGDGAIGAYIESAGYAGTSQSVSTQAGWMYVGIHWQHLSTGQTRIRWRQNATTTQFDVTTPAMTSTVAPYLQVTAWMIGRSWSNFQVWYDYDPPTTWPGETHTPQATLDPGLNLLTHLPDVVNADGWDTIKDIAGAEYGLAGFDASGVFAFRQRTTATDPTSVEKTITADRALIDLATETSTDSVCNVVTTETTAGYLDFNTKIVESKDDQQWQTPVGISTYDVPLEWGAIGTTTQQIPQIASSLWNDTYLWGFVVVRADLPDTELPAPSGVTVLFTMASDRLGQLTVRNFSSYPVRFATPSGSPALRVQGWSLVEDPAQLAEVRSDGSVELYGERALAISSSPWRQIQAPLREVSGGILATLANPVPSLDEIQVVGDPRVGIGDTVRLVDPQGHGSMRATVVKIRRSFADGKITDSIGLRPVNPPGLGILDDTELGILDDTLILAP